MTVSRRVLTACGVLSAALVVQGIVALYGFSKVRSSVGNMTEDSVPGLVYSGLVGQEVYHLRSINQHQLASPDAKDLAAAEASSKEIIERLHQDMRDFESTIRDDEERQVYNRLSRLNQEYEREWAEVAPLTHTGDKTTAAVEYFKRTGATVKEINKTMPLLNAVKQKHQNAHSRLILDMASRSLWTLLAIFIASSGLAGFATYHTLRSVNRQLREAVDLLGEASDQIISAASHVSQSSQATAQGSSEQAAKIEETSAASAEIHAMARSTNDNAKSASEIVTESQRGFEQANGSLGEMVSAMGGIQESGQKISKIIKVIEEIAFQTNILALNAAVEAARAGAAGAGFSVVAGEVRNLAQRSAQAAEDTVGLIAESIGRSNEGKARVDQLATALNGITEESLRIKGLVETINRDSVEQRQGLEQINRAMKSMEEFTQTNAASAEEGAAAAEELNAQAGVLKEIVYNLRTLVDSNYVERRKVLRSRAVLKALRQNVHTFDRGADARRSFVGERGQA